MIHKRMSYFLLTLLIMLVACGTTETTDEKEDGKVQWSYEGEDGPENWGDLDPSFEACGTGEAQSPVDISMVTAEDLENITFNYASSDLMVLNNGHTVQVNYDAGSSIELDGKTFNLLQYHYHAPSEHAVDGQLFDGEIHFVHANDDGSLAVVGVLITEGAENSAYASFLDNMPGEEAEVESKGVMTSAIDMLPDDKTTYRYSGSLTTPPCSEVVSWLVMTTPIELSAAQITALTTPYAGNNRPVQPLYDRGVVEDSTP